MGNKARILTAIVGVFFYVSVLEAADINEELKLEIKKKQDAAKVFWRNISLEAKEAFDKNKKRKLEKLLEKVDENIPAMVASGATAGKLRAYVLNQIGALNFNKHGYAKCARLSEEALYYDPDYKYAIEMRHWSVYHPRKCGIKRHTDEACTDSRIKSKALKEKKKLNAAFEREWGKIKKIYDKAMSEPKEKKEAALKKALKPLKKLCSNYKYFWACGKIDDVSNDPRYALARTYAELAIISSDNKDQSQAVQYAKEACKAWPNAGELLMKEDWVFDTLVILGEFKKPDGK
jgi:hypothetical protein